MSLNIEIYSASSAQIEAAICAELAQFRLNSNMSQQQLADQAGVSLRTIKRMEAGEGTSADTLIRVLLGLGLGDNLKLLVPDTSIRPLERVAKTEKKRRRARTQKVAEPNKAWSWADDA